MVLRNCGSHKFTEGAVTEVLRLLDKGYDSLSLLMPTTAQEVYSQVVRTLSPNERLRLATLILNELVQQNMSIEQSDTWTEEDQTDLVNFSLQYAATMFPEDEEIA